MSGILVVAETRRDEVREITHELIAAAGQLKEKAQGPVKVAVIAAEPDRFVEALAVDGVDEVLTVRSPTAHFEPHLATAALEALVEREGPSLVLLGHSIDSLGFGPAVAARRGLGFASDVTAVDWSEGPVARRGAYGEKLVAELDFPDKECALLMLRAGAFEPTSGGAGSASASAVEVELDGEAIASEHLEFREVATEGVDITAADFLVSIGRGVDDQDNIEQFERLAEAVGATLSVSRPLVDAGWMPNSRQVGQSGKTVKPQVYLALGISGAVQHQAGMQGSGTIIAVNTDPEAPIFNIAHYGAVADMFEVAEELEKQF